MAREVDAEDVVASVDRLLDKVTGSTARVSLLGTKDVMMIDKHTARFNLNIPYAGFSEIQRRTPSKYLPRAAADERGWTAPHDHRYRSNRSRGRDA